MPWCPEERGSFPTLLVNMAHLYLAVDPYESLTLSRRAIALSPRDWQAMANAAEACRALAESDSSHEKAMSKDVKSKYLAEGLQHITKALSINPQDTVSRITYANLLLVKRDFAVLNPLVIDIVNSGAGSPETNVSAHILLIRTLIATGQLADAEAWLTPMTQYDELASICSQLRKDMDRRRMELGSGAI